MSKFDPEIKNVLDALLLGLPGIQPGKMFGFPAYYAGKKLAICIYEQSVGIKLPEQTVKLLLNSDPHTAPFQPYGKSVMREWVQIYLSDPEEYAVYLALFEESIRFVSAIKK